VQIAVSVPSVRSAPPPPERLRAVAARDREKWPRLSSTEPGIGDTEESRGSDAHGVRRHTNPQPPRAHATDRFARSRIDGIAVKEATWPSSLPPVRGASVDGRSARS
jgi:hypothetical protein